MSLSLGTPQYNQIVCSFLCKASFTSIKLLRFIHCHITVCWFFLLLSNIPLYGYSFICLSRLFSWKSILFPKATMNIFVKDCYESKLFFLRKYLKVELLHHGIGICLLLKKTVRSFSKAVVPFPIPPIMCENSGYSTSLPTFDIISRFSWYSFW